MVRVGRNTGSPAIRLAAKLADEHYSLARWAARYLAEEVYGRQSPHTLEAKKRDLAAFVRWFGAAKGHDRIDSWSLSDTQLYLAGLKKLGRAPATINRVLATMRRFARWVHEQPGALFERGGLPTRGLKELPMAAAPVEALDRQTLMWIFQAADALVQSDERGCGRPRRNRAILALLALAGVRVSEVVQLRREQYVNHYLLDVPRKGQKRKHSIYLASLCQRALDDYVKYERGRDDAGGAAVALFLPSGGGGGGAGSGFMTRQQVGKVLQQLALAAERLSGRPVDLSPNRLRHTFGSALLAHTGSLAHTAAALGHVGQQHVKRYAGPVAHERENAVEQLAGSMRAAG